MVSRDNAVKKWKHFKASSVKIFFKMILCRNFVFFFSPWNRWLCFLYGSYNDRNWIGSGENSDCISSTRFTEMIFFFHIPMVFYYSRSLEMNVQEVCASIVHSQDVSTFDKRIAAIQAIHPSMIGYIIVHVTISFSITKALLRNFYFYVLLLFFW